MEENYIGQKIGQPQFKKIQDYCYRFCDEIGTGNFSKVYKGVHEPTRKIVAIKTIELSSLNTHRLQELLNTETQILKILSHPNVIQCDHILSSLRNCYIITELCQGGDLEKELKKQGKFKEYEIFEIALNVFRGLKYLNSEHIVHRDLKISNIFIQNRIYKIADFGFAQRSQVEFKDISVGSPVYMSPQGYIQNVYGPKTDVWAFGVMLYELVQGKTPFSSCQTEEELKLSLAKQIDASSFSQPISSKLKDLIIGCMTVQVKQRMSISQIENSEWIKHASKLVKDQQSIPNPIKNKLFPKSQMPKNEPAKAQFPKGQISKRENLKNQSNIIAKQHRQKHAIKFNNLIEDVKKVEQKVRKHLTQEKLTVGERLFEHQKTINLENKNNNSSIFYSPKNILKKFSHQFHDSIKNGASVGPLRNASGISAQAPDLADGREKDKLNKNIFEKEKKKLNIDSYINNKKDDSYLHNKKDAKNNQKDQKYNEKIHEIAKNNFRQNNQQSITHVKSPTTTQWMHNSNDKNKNQLLNEYKKFFHQSTNIEKVEKSQKTGSRTTKGEDDNDKQNYIQGETSKFVIKKTMRFSDCIGLIHYCRLCYKLSKLLSWVGSEQAAAQFFIIWSVQLLFELMEKVKSGDIAYGNNHQNLIANMSVEPQNDKKKKLKDVIEEYLSKYSKDISGHFPNKKTLKQASSFSYELYLRKGNQFKKKATYQQQYLALICYLSLLDKETRNLAEFAYEIKNGLDGKKIEKMLSLKTEQFTKDKLEEIMGADFKKCET